MINDAHATADGLVDSLADDAVTEARLELYADALDQPERLGTFTDEELVGLDGMPERPPSPSPWYSGLHPDQQEAAVVAALRGLTARGSYVALHDDDMVQLRMPPEILALLTMRRLVPSIVVAERVTAEQKDWAVLYEQRAGLWLGEYVDHRGMHEFVLATAEETAASLVLWSGAQPDPPAPGLDITLSRSELSQQPAALAAVAECSSAITVTRMDGDPDAPATYSGIYTSAEACYLSTTPPESDTVRYRGATQSQVLQHWAELLGAP